MFVKSNIQLLRVEFVISRHLSPHTHRVDSPLPSRFPCFPLHVHTSSRPVRWRRSSDESITFQNIFCLFTSPAFCPTKTSPSSHHCLCLASHILLRLVLFFFFFHGPHLSLNRCWLSLPARQTRRCSSRYCPPSPSLRGCYIHGRDLVRP